MSLNQTIKNHCIALTGSICTGKSTVAKEFEQLGYAVIDADQLSREAVSPGSNCLLKITKAFGSDVVNSVSGELDRKKLAEIVFNDQEKLKLLESITHPEIRNLLETKVENFLSTNPEHKILIYEAALIFEKKLENDFLSTMCTFCDPETQLRRLIKRDNISEQKANKIISNQEPADIKAKKAHFSIDTSGSFAEIQDQVKKISTSLKNI